jgi:hypothetical protein
VEAARAGAPERTVELRYESVAEDSGAAADRIAAFLGSEPGPLVDALARVHGESVGRWRRDLHAGQIADVEAEAGALLSELGYA